MAVYLFFDESGDFAFSPSGSRYYFFGALTTHDPMPLTHALTALRYQLLGSGLEIERFHAAEDRQAVRDRVFSTIKMVGSIEFDLVAIEKRKANPVLYDPVRFYPQFANYLMKYVFARYADPAEPIVIVTDTIPVQRKRKAVEKAFKTYVSRNLGKRPYTLVHQSSGSHACLQAADYLTWAVHKKWTHGDRRSYDMVRHLIRSEFDIFAGGGEYFY